MYSEEQIKLHTYVRILRPDQRNKIRQFLAWYADAAYQLKNINNRGAWAINNYEYILNKVW